LAIGLTNAKTLVKLENFVDELKSLNDEYQKQNIQIKKQNESLIELSHQLHAKARELEIQKEKAEESTKLKSQFLASMSHELRTPLNSILGLTELILYKTQLSQKDKERLGVVLKSSKRLMTLINDILDLSKIEAGKMKIIEEDILLEEIIDEVSNIASPLASEKGLAFNVLKKCNTKIIIITDRGRVTQVLLNLIDNAIKFTQNGSVELSINITPEKLLMFSVSDTGIGISEENKKIIFEEFRQVDGAASKKYNGTGLGLAICKKIVLLLGGNISVFSNEREGSTFSFTIPINYSSQKIQNDFTPIIPVARKNIKHPLIVFDNDTEVKYTISQYLISKGYSIVSIDYTEENIISAFEQTQFVINLEMLLPINDGWGAIAKLKNISVVFISLIGETKVAFGLGSFNYFVKPFSLDRFYLALPKLQLLLKKQIQKLFAITDINSEINICLERDVSKKISIDVIENNNYAFNKILEGQPDIIVFDLLLTDVKNLKLFFNLKSNPKTKQIPLIISSAKEITETEKQYFSSFVKEVSLNEKENDNSFIERSNTKSHSIDDSITSLSFSNTDSNSDNNILMKSNIQNMGDVLIVDDDPDTLFTLNELVQSVGCKTYTAKSGIDCLKILEKVKPALILLDIMMPEMDGFQTLKNIRSNINNASIPIFAVTAKAMVGDREIILKHGFDDYLSKPVSSLVLSDKLNQFFSKY
jgi:signal transduction histidine kinase/CheY-like chemotaxis protein